MNLRLDDLALRLPYLKHDAGRKSVAPTLRHDRQRKRPSTLVRTGRPDHHRAGQARVVPTQRRARARAVRPTPKAP